MDMTLVLFIVGGCFAIIGSLIGAMWVMISKKLEKSSALMTSVALLASDVDSLKTTQANFLQEFKQYAKDLHEMVLFKSEMKTQWNKFDREVSRLNDFERRVQSLELEVMKMWTLKNKGG